MDQHITIDTDRSALDLDFIHHFISNSYWAKNRTRAEMQTCIDHSLNFGVFLHGRQIGYARVVTDYAVFAYVMDLFIDEQYRHRGFAKRLVNAMLDESRLSNIRVWKLTTTDAHALYAQFGFKPLTNPGNMMEKK